MDIIGIKKMKEAYAGQPEFDMKQQQIQQVYREYKPQAKIASVEVEVPKPDIFDNAYVALRTIVPGWMMAVFIAVGMMTMATITFKKQIKNLIIIWGDLLKGQE